MASPNGSGEVLIGGTPDLMAESDCFSKSKR